MKVEWGTNGQELFWQRQVRRYEGMTFLKKDGVKVATGKENFVACRTGKKKWQNQKWKEKR